MRLKLPSIIGGLVQQKPMWHVKHYGLQVAGQEVAKTTLKTANGNHIRICTAKNTGSGKHEQTKSTQSKGWGQEATAILIPQKAPSVKIVTCAKLSCTLIHMVTGYSTDRRHNLYHRCHLWFLSYINNQAASASIRVFSHGHSRLLQNQPTRLGKMQAAAAAVKTSCTVQRPHYVTAMFWRRNQPRCNSQNFQYVTAERELGPAATAKFCVVASHRSCILRESLLLVGWHCHQLSSYLLHCHPALQEAPGHTASTQLSTLSQYSWVPPHCP